MAQYAIFRARKLFRGRGKNAFAVCVRHLDRHKQSADISHPEYSEYNDTELYYNGKAINQIDQAIARHKEITGKNLRADASVAVEMIFTYSKDAPIDDDLFDERVRQFVAKNFPSMQLLRIDYHADETTSHWHIVGIPTTPDGRISAKEVLGGPATFRQHQTNFAMMVQDLGLQRGVSKAKRKQRGENTRNVPLRVWKGQMVAENKELKEKIDYLESADYRNHLLAENVSKKAQKVIEEVFDR